MKISKMIAITAAHIAQAYTKDPSMNFYQINFLIFKCAETKVNSFSFSFEKVSLNVKGMIKLLDLYLMFITDSQMSQG
jgi:hypothetical protein